MLRAVDENSNKIEDDAKSNSSFHLCSGKTTLLSVLAHGAPVETVPTIGLNVKVFKKGSVNMKCWDIGTSQKSSHAGSSFLATIPLLYHLLLFATQEDKNNIEVNGVGTQRGVMWFCT